MNDLIKAATPLILMITQIRHSVGHPDVADLQTQIISEIKNFESKLANYPNLKMTTARYCLCTAIDEAILSQIWGRNSMWVQNSLLSIFHKETWGGERFYVILEEALGDPTNNMDFIEFAYFLLNLGFEGKFFGEENKKNRKLLCDQLFNMIRQARIRPEWNLSSDQKSTDAGRWTRNRKKILAWIGLGSLAMIILMMIFYNVQVYRQAQPMMDELEILGKGSPTEFFNTLVASSRSGVLDSLHKKESHFKLDHKTKKSKYKKKEKAL